MQGSNWTRFWQSERHAFDEVMQLATKYFAKQLCKAFPIQEGVRVLDYGCGPGFLADALLPRKVIFTGTDINEYFINLCKVRYPRETFFTIHTQPGENASLLKKYVQSPSDYIVLLSISQYLPAPSELEQIIASLKPHLAAGGHIIVADVVDENTQSYRDALSLLSHALRKGKLASFVRFMRYVLRSEYARVAKTTQLQHISESFMVEMAERLKLSCRRVDGLTFHPTRKNYVLRYK